MIEGFIDEFKLYSRPLGINELQMSAYPLNEMSTFISLGCIECSLKEAKDVNSALNSTYYNLKNLDDLGKAWEKYIKEGR